MNRANRRAQAANAQSRARKTAKVHDTLARRVGTGLDTLRALASLESGIPTQFVGVAVQGEAVQIWDTRVATVVLRPIEPTMPVLTVDEVDEKSWEPAEAPVEGGAV